MAAIAPSAIPRDRAFHYAKVALGVAFSAFLGGLFAAWLTYEFTARLNNETALQQQYLSSVQEFISSGSEVDGNITNLADSILDGQEVRQARQDARAALAGHVDATTSLSQVVGDGNSNLYMEGLAKLRTYIDAANSPQSAREMSDARFDVMDNRRIIVAEARKRIYDRP
ncbi:MAG: hypothetical protein KKE77_10525 [Alphaproteobacteria bacterium]|nr:hypothetical protein [Alphaproteobacteria bacterium]